MDMADILILWALEWVYEPLANRFGKLIASIVVGMLALATLAVIVWILIRLLSD